MKIKNDISGAYLNNLQTAWYSNDKCDIEDVRRIMDKFKNIGGAHYLTLPVFFIIDYTAQQYLLMTDALTAISGYHPKEFLEIGLDKLIEVFHKDDFIIFNNKVFARNVDFMSALPHGEQDQYVFSYNFRFAGSNRKFVHVLQRTTYITSKETGLPLYSIGSLTDITDFKTNSVIVHTIEKTGAEHDRSILEKNFYYPNGEDALLTGREKEVLLYMAEGYSSKQIAGKLKISENTIGNHRVNMLCKTNTKNVAELMAFCIRNGII